MEFETRIDETGHIYVPEEFHNAYGKRARLVVLLPDQAESLKNPLPARTKLYHPHRNGHDVFDQSL